MSQNDHSQSKITEFEMEMNNRFVGSNFCMLNHKRK